MATQQHVSETLRRAVASGRVGHAYLFCGPRGVGKTTLARVLAMALNCPERGEDGEPCGRCESCQRTWSGHTALDVIEIDAASNRGVDDARDLRERAMYAPSEADRFKIYIVDEAHMLTREAWNALLKILEEPPSRVVFIFATTEPQKIQQSAAPILSRCQRFDFRRIAVPDIVDRLTRVLELEGVEAPPEALRLIARKADGGMRDGLSLMDQVLALTAGEVDPDAVRRVLGLVEDERYLELFALLRGDRPGDIFAFVEALLDEGYDLVEFYHGLVDVLRAVLRGRLGGAAAQEVREDLRDAFREHGEAFSPGDLVRMLSLASELEANGSLRRSANPRLLLEMLLLRFGYLDRTVEMEELLQALGGGPPPDGSAGRDDSGRDGSHRDGSGGARAGSARSADAAPPSPEVAPARDAVSAEPGGDASPIDPRQAWERMLSAGKVPAGMGPFLRAATVTEGEDDELTVRLPEGPALERLRDPSILHQVTSALTAHLGRSARVVVAGPDAPRGAGRITQDTVRNDRLRELLSREPVLEQAVEELDLELLD